MKVRLVCDLPPSEGNPRNSEGSFLRAPSGEILFAYSAYCGTSPHDHAACNIKMIRSRDEGESWSEPEMIATAAFFGTENIMSVSALTLTDGALAFYFLIKENDGTSTLGRSISRDGGATFTPERINWDVPAAYYVINNDRLVRTSDGKIIAPAAYYPPCKSKYGIYNPAITVLLVSEDDGASFKMHHFARLCHSDTVNRKYGLQEPGIIELSRDVFWIWMRTGASYQYQSYSLDGLKSFTTPEPSGFTSPDSPMQVVRYDANTLYAVYNPVPNYNGKDKTPWGWGRTPIVIRKSTDNGKTFGELNTVEAGERGFCYPAVFFTADGSMLCAYCRGGEEDVMCLCRLGIVKFALEEVK